jgi:hypothetical protein
MSISIMPFTTNMSLAGWRKFKNTVPMNLVRNTDFTTMNFETG